MTDEIPKYKIGFTQSVSSGIISFHGEIEYNDIDLMLQQNENLLSIFEDIQYRFKKAGYSIASDIEPKKDKKNGSK